MSTEQSAPPTETNPIGGDACAQNETQDADPLADLRHQLRQAATALARNRDERAVIFSDALMRLDFGRVPAGPPKLDPLADVPAGLESGASLRGEDAPPAGAIAVGDVVRLNSGGVWMTVDTIVEDKAYCIWFGPICSHPHGEVFGITGLEKR